MHKDSHLITIFVDEHFLNFNIITMKLLDEFKQFAIRGNVVDMAVGIIIGGAFGKIVSSLVADVVMPAIGLVVGGVNFTDLKITLKPEVLSSIGEVLNPAVTLNYGNFIQVVFDFIIIAFSIFAMIRLMNKLNRKPAPASEPAAPAPIPEDIALLSEIRDLLKKNN